MRALVLSLLPPPPPGAARRGTAKRIALYVRALHSLGADIEIGYYVGAGVQDLSGRARLQESIEAVNWGFPVRVALIPEGERPSVRTVTNAARYAGRCATGVVYAAAQPGLAPYAGTAQAEAVGTLLDSQPDLVVVNGLHAACAILRSGRRPRLYFDLDDVQHLARLRWGLSRPYRAERLLMLSHLPALLAAERFLSSAAEATFVCSEGDRQHLLRFGFPRVTVVPNAVEVPPEPAGRGAEPTLLFVGWMGYAPNHEAAERLALRVFPLVRRRRPDARLKLVGVGSERLPSRKSSPQGVEYCGFVPEIADVYRRHTVFVCPMLNGGGTRIKILEAAAFGLPIVSTRVGAEGIALRNGVEILLADDDQEIADLCLRLLEDPLLAERTGAAARTAISERYNARLIERELADLFRRAVPAGGEAPHG